MLCSAQEVQAIILMAFSILLDVLRIPAGVREIGSVAQESFSFTGVGISPFLSGSTDQTCTQPVLVSRESCVVQPPSSQGALVHIQRREARMISLKCQTWEEGRQDNIFTIMEEPTFIRPGQRWLSWAGEG